MPLPAWTSVLCPLNPLELVQEGLDLKLHGLECSFSELFLYTSIHIYRSGNGKLDRSGNVVWFSFYLCHLMA